MPDNVVDLGSKDVVLVDIPLTEEDLLKRIEELKAQGSSQL